MRLRATRRQEKEVGRQKMVSKEHSKRAFGGWDGVGLWFVFGGVSLFFFFGGTGGGWMS